MSNLSKALVSLLICLLLISHLEGKAKISKIDDSNFEKLKNDGSYWIIQISNSPCSECQAH